VEKRVSKAVWKEREAAVFFFFFFFGDLAEVAIIQKKI
jgi:hypothetical protein